MNIREALAMCTFRASNLGDVGGNYDGINCIDLMHALGAIDVKEGPRLLARAKWMGENWGHKLVNIYMLSEVSKIASEKNWNNKEDDKPLIKMCMLALAEYLSPAICMSCNDQKGVMIGNKWEECTTCNGTGLPNYNEETRAQIIDMPIIRWINVWAPRYPHVQAMLRGWDEDVMAKMQRRFEKTLDKVG